MKIYKQQENLSSSKNGQQPQKNTAGIPLFSQSSKPCFPSDINSFDQQSQFSSYQTKTRFNQQRPPMKLENEEQPIIASSIPDVQDLMKKRDLDQVKSELISDNFSRRNPTASISGGGSF